MAESKAHMDFVRRIVSYSGSNISMCDPALIQAELPEFYARTPRVIGGYFPDVYHKGTNCILIGEAKTDNDIENPHTEAQLNCYIEEVRCYNVERHIVLCSSIFSYALLKNMIVRKNRREALDDITFHVLDVHAKSAVI